MATVRLGRQTWAALTDGSSTGAASPAGQPAALTFVLAGCDPLTSYGPIPAAALRAQLHEAFAASILLHGGRELAAAMDGGVVAVFASAGEAVAAAVDLRSAVAKAAQPVLVRSLRVAVHNADDHAARRRAERLYAIASGGQTLLSAAAAAAFGWAPLPGVVLLDRGMHRLRDLSSPIRVYELHLGEAAAQSSPLRSVDMVANNLPTQFTSFVGRHAELDAVKKLLRHERLVTLTGAGGSGKTRLCAQVAAETVELWMDGVWWVDLSAVTAPALVPESVSGAIGTLVDPTGCPLSSLESQLRNRRLLLCLDNCEQVLEGVARMVEALLRGCPEVVVLTTSREPLAVPGEAVWAVPPLGPQEAVSLFVERATHLQPQLAMNEASESAVRSMCVRLDGLPLALELAAAWIRTLTPEQIEAALDDRFALLVRGPRGVSARQQTLTASMDWSHDLLDEEDQVVFRRLSVFSGGFTLDAARATCAGDSTGRDGVLVAMGRLVDKSLVVAEVGDGGRRYRLLETIRQYAGGRLNEAGETSSTRDAHLNYFLDLAEAAEPELDRDKDAWRARLEVEHENLRAAVEWGLAAQDPTRGRRLAAALPWLWHLNRLGHEGLDLLQRAIGRAPEERTSLQAKLLTGIALVADTARPLDVEFNAAQRALEIATAIGERRLQCLSLQLSAVGMFYTDLEAGWDMAVEAQRLAEAVGDEFVVDASRALQGIILHLRDEHHRAQETLRTAADRLLRRGDRGIAATTVGFQASSALYSGKLAVARELAERAVEIAKPLGDYHRVGTAHSVLATVYGLSGQVEAGLELMEPVAHWVDSANNDVFIPGVGTTIGSLHLWRGDLKEAERWLRPEAWLTDRGADTHIAAQARSALAAVLRQMGRREEAGGILDGAMVLARRLGMPRVLADTLEQRAHLAADDPDRAAVLHHEALALRVDHGLRTFAVDSLDALAALAARAGRLADAVRMVAASDRTRRETGCPPRPVREAAHNEAIAKVRAAACRGEFAAARESGAGRTLDEVVALVRRSRGARRRPSTGWASLTPTELDVVRLTAEGLTNPEIGARLFMSRGTVKTHLAHVYAKLGVANRTELATLAGPRLTKD